MMPLWLYTVGMTFYAGTNMQLPWQNIVISLFILIVPALIGMVFGEERYEHSAAWLKQATTGHSWSMGYAKS
jgi:hypothetical protein